MGAWNCFRLICHTLDTKGQIKMPSCPVPTVVGERVNLLPLRAGVWGKHETSIIKKSTCLTPDKEGGVNISRQDFCPLSRASMTWTPPKGKEAVSADRALPGPVSERFVGQSQLSPVRFSATCFVNNNNNNINNKPAGLKEFYCHLYDFTCVDKNHYPVLIVRSRRVHAEFNLKCTMRWWVDKKNK